ncbi:MAG: hypothetical protein P1V20_22010 [Verrucomicrobiales bacterium]|nr:hypothetical protein [Verrucomicrobiales bacterium]
MHQTQFTPIPERITELADELLQFQWYFDEESILTVGDSAGVQLSDIIAIPLREVNQHIEDIDAALRELGTGTTGSDLRNLVALLDSAIGRMKKLRPELTGHGISAKVLRDFDALTADYKFFRSELNRWMQYLYPTGGRGSANTSNGSMTFAMEMADLK